MNEKRKPTDRDSRAIVESASSTARSTQNGEARKPYDRDSSPLAPERTSSPGRWMRILLVDDSAAILSFVKAGLQRLSCEFVEANDGERALRIATLMPLDLIIADVNMPGMGGIELIEALRRHPSGRLAKIPVLLLTGEKDESVRKRGLAAGARGLIHKPVDGTALVAAVSRLLAESRP